jgi:hypothetical protein
VSVVTVGKTLTHITQNIIKVIKEGCDLAVHNHTPAEEAKWEQDVRDVFKDSESTSADGARTAAKEDVTKHLMDGGMSKADAERLFEHRWQKVKALADKVHAVKPKVEQAGRFLWLKLGAALLVGGWVLTAITGAHRPEAESDKMYRFIQREAAETAQMQSFLASQEQFNEMIGGLEVEQSAPVPTPGVSPVAAAAVPEPLPAAVAARAEEPVVVEVVTPSRTQSFTSNIGRVYRNVPQQARQEIERQVPKIDHGYDHENLNDCVHTHCMSGHHKDFTVVSPIGTAHFKY